jgi:hypothetical protein
MAVELCASTFLTFIISVTDLLPSQPPLIEQTSRQRAAFSRQRVCKRFGGELARKRSPLANRPSVHLWPTSLVRSLPFKEYRIRNNKGERSETFSSSWSVKISGDWRDDSGRSESRFVTVCTSSDKTDGRYNRSVGCQKRDSSQEKKHMY